MGKQFEDADQKAIAAQPEVFPPVRAPSAHSDVDVPLEQAAIIGLFVTVPVVALLYVVGVQLAFDKWLVLGLVLFCVVTLPAFFWRVGVVTEGLHRIEEWTGIDFEGDGSIGAHPASLGRGPAERVDPVQRAQDGMLRFVEVFYASGGNHHGLRSAGFTDAEINIYRQALIDKGAVTWAGKTHNAGVKLLMTKEQALVAVENIIWLPNGKPWRD